MEELNELIRQIHNERTRKSPNDYEEQQRLGEDVYLMFRIWCYSESRDKDIHDALLFSKYLKDNNIKFTLFQRRHLAKKYFGYKNADCEEANT